MMDYTDRHCRYLLRLLSPRSLLYSEMVTAQALTYGDTERLLGFDEAEHPVALQLGGSDPAMLAHAAKLGEQRGYDEINLNVGCPSERVQSGSFGACLMAEPELVAECMTAMREAVSTPVTVKCRIGIDELEDYGFFEWFVLTVRKAGVDVFIVHARNAILQGLTPKENREVPPLRYEVVYQLKRDFPELTIVLNGGVKDEDEIAQHLLHLDGVMVGRQAYHEPWSMANWDTRFYGEAQQTPQRDAVEAAMVDYMTGLFARGEPWSRAARHMLGLHNGLPGARRWRQVWSDHHLKGAAPAEVSALARQRVLPSPPAVD
jgi:tRNA-dihydrouridine synthase A